MLLLALAKTLANANEVSNHKVTFAELMMRYGKDYWVLFTIPMLAALAIYINQDFLLDAQTLSAAVRQQIWQHDFIQSHGRASAHVAITLSYSTYFARESRCFMASLGDWFYLMQILPAQLVMLAVLYLNVESFRFKPQLFGGALASILAPLAMLLVAWDVERIWTYLAIANLWACLIIVTVFKLRPARHLPLTAGLVLAYALLVQNLTPYPLVDGAADRLQWVLPKLQLPFTPAAPATRVVPCPSVLP